MKKKEGKKEKKKKGKKFSFLVIGLLVLEKLEIKVF